MNLYICSKMAIFRSSINVLGSSWTMSGIMKYRAAIWSFFKAHAYSMYFILPEMVHQFGLVEFRIVVIVSFRKKSKQIFYIRHIQIDELTWTKDSFFLRLSEWKSFLSTES